MRVTHVRKCTLETKVVLLQDTPYTLKRSSKAKHSKEPNGHIKEFTLFCKTSLEKGDTLMNDNGLLFIGDLPALFARCYFAQAKNKDAGRYFGVFRLATYLQRFLRDYEPNQVILASDGQGSQRREWFAGYKDRETKPPDYYSQYAIAEMLVAQAGFVNLSVPMWEADDVIASLCKGRKQVIVLTGDKDMLQLVGDGVIVDILAWSEKDKSHVDRYATAEDVYQKLGVYPSQVADYKALCGDTSDTYGGVKGIGPVAAVKLLETYGSVEEAFRHTAYGLSLITNKAGRSMKLGKKLVWGREQYLLNLKLATLNYDLPLVIPPDLSPPSSLAVNQAVKNVKMSLGIPLD